MSSSKNVRKINRKTTKRIQNLIFTALCISLSLVLPLLTGQIPQIGQALSPMHFPALLCGFICGPMWGLVEGAIAPLLRCLIFGMPPIFSAIPMAFELAAYGFMTGLLYKLLPKKLPFIYVSLVGAMVVGRVVWGVVKWTMSVANASSFGFQAFIAGTVTGSIPGIVLQIILVPIIVAALHRAKLIDNDD